jgi:hypothetical protein
MKMLQVLSDLFDDKGFDLFGRSGLEFMVRLFVDILTVGIIVRMIYYKHYRRADLLFTFFSMNIIIFLISFLLNKVEMTMGAAFGLFAVFSMLRYRTENISAKDMTYVFIVIAVGLLTSVSSGGWQELMLVSGVIILSTFALESDRIIRHEHSRHITYEKIELIHKDKEKELLADLRARTGLDIHRVVIGKLDFLKEAADITIYYH